MLITDLHGHVTVCECVVRVERLEQLIIFLERHKQQGAAVITQTKSRRVIRNMASLAELLCFTLLFDTRVMSQN